MLRVLFAVVLAVAALVGSGVSPATAAPLPVLDVTYPAGTACADLDLVIHGTGGNQVVKEFTDRDGTLVKISAGTGQALTFTNGMDPAKSIPFPSSFSTTITKTNPADGSSTVVLLGSNVLILFPTDVPPGPSTTLHQGLVIFTSDAAQNFVVQHTRSKTTDICAAVR